MFVAINGVRLFFDVLNPKLELAGDGLREKPTLLCLHGGPGGDHQSLRPFFDRFSALAQVNYLDQRGGGRSDHGDAESWTLDQWGDDVAAFCDALGIVRPIVLGVYGGAIVTQAYLARHPNHAGGAVLVNACSRMDRAVLVSGFEALGGAGGRTGGQGDVPQRCAGGRSGLLSPLPAFLFPHRQFRRLEDRRNPADLQFRCQLGILRTGRRGFPIRSSGTAGRSRLPCAGPDGDA